MRTTLALSLAEARMLARNSTAWSTAIALPLLLGGYWIISDPMFGAGWSAVIVLQVMMLLVFTLHTVGTMAIASRRQQLVLKRWRSSEASDTSVLVATLSVPVALLLVQAAALTAITMAVSGEQPVNLLVMIVAVLVATATIGALTFVVSAFTRTAEHAMITTFPVVAGVVGGSVAAMIAPLGEMAQWWLVVPGAAATELLRLGWEGPPAGGSLWSAAAPALGASIALTVVSAVVALRTFRWEPRD